MYVYQDFLYIYFCRNSPLVVYRVTKQFINPYPASNKAVRCTQTTAFNTHWIVTHPLNL